MLRLDVVAISVSGGLVGDRRLCRDLASGGRAGRVAPSPAYERWRRQSWGANQASCPYGSLKALRTVLDSDFGGLAHFEPSLVVSERPPEGHESRAPDNLWT